MVQYQLIVISKHLWWNWEPFWPRPGLRSDTFQSCLTVFVCLCIHKGVKLRWVSTAACLHQSTECTHATLHLKPPIQHQRTRSGRAWSRARAIKRHVHVCCCLWKVLLSRLLLFSAANLLLTVCVQRWLSRLTVPFPVRPWPLPLPLNYHLSEAGRGRGREREEGYREARDRGKIWLSASEVFNCLHWWPPHLLAWHTFPCQGTSCINK